MTDSNFLVRGAAFYNLSSNVEFLMEAAAWPLKRLRKQGFTEGKWHEMAILPKKSHRKRRFTYKKLVEEWMFAGVSACEVLGGRSAGRLLRAQPLGHLGRMRGLGPATGRSLGFKLAKACFGGFEQKLCV